MNLILPEELGQFAVFAKLLNRLENYRIVLIPLPIKKQIGCSGQYCTEILEIAPPDDAHPEFSLSKPEGESLPREYKCSKNHITKGYWYMGTYSPVL